MAEDADKLPSNMAVLVQPEEFYLPDMDFFNTRPVNVNTSQDDGVNPVSREHVGAEREVASIAHKLVVSPHGKMVVYLARPKSMHLLANQARAITAWHGPAAALLCMVDQDKKAQFVASVSKDQSSMLSAIDWVSVCAKLLGSTCDGDNRLAVGVDGNYLGMREALPMLESFARRNLGID